MAIVQQKTYYSTDIHSILKSVMTRYSYSMDELRELRESSVEDRSQRVRELLDSILLDMVGDLTFLTRYRVDNSSDYYSKNIDPVISYLRDLRNTILLLKSTEK